MPDLLAGTIVNAGDTPPTVANVQDGLFTFNATTYGTDNDSGTYVDCGVAFTAPTTERVAVALKGQILNDTGGVQTVMSFVVRTGSTVGAGTLFLAADDSRAIMVTGANLTMAYGIEVLVTGLTPGSVYNVRLEHRVSGASNGQLGRRSIIVAPAT